MKLSFSTRGWAHLNWETWLEAGESMRYALIVVATVPILTVYPFIQKYFAKGVMIGSVKG